MQLKDLLEEYTTKKVKIFSSSSVKSVESIENSVNEWLHDQGRDIAVFDIKQSVTTGERSIGKDITISIWYVEY